MSTTATAAIYARVSRAQGDREVAGSVEQQLDACRRKAAELGLQVVEVHSEEISAYSGARRPAFDALCESIRQGRVGHVVAWSTERIVRRMDDLERYVQVCEPRTVLTSTVVSTPLDLSNPTGLMVARITVAVASFEVEQLKGRVQRGIARRSESGLPAGGRVPFGFLPDKITHHPVESEAIRAATDAVLAGESIRNIARGWNESGLVTRTGKQWTPTTVRTVLMRPRNAGLVQRKGVAGGRASWAPIVTYDRWHAVCQLIPTRRTSPGSQPTWLLSFIVRCGAVLSDGTACGAFVKSWRSGYDRHGKTRISYRCTVENRTEPHPTVPAHALDAYVTEKLIGGYWDQGFGFPLTEVSPTGDPEAAVEIRDEVARRRRVLIGEYTAGRLDDDEYRVAMDALDLRDLQAETPRLVTVVPGADSLESLEAEWSRMSIDQRRSIVRDTVDITIHRVGPGHRVPMSERVTLRWKFKDFDVE